VSINALPDRESGGVAAVLACSSSTDIATPMMTNQRTHLWPRRTDVGWALPCGHPGPHVPPDDPETDMALFDVRVTVERIEGRSVCGMQVDDYFVLVNSAELRLPTGRHFCIYALQSVLPMLPAKQRQLPANDWLAQDSMACCHDPEERLLMRIERIGRRRR